jgi:hypothetical protein
LASTTARSGAVTGRGMNHGVGRSTGAGSFSSRHGLNRGNVAGSRVNANRSFVSINNFNRFGWGGYGPYGFGYGYGYPFRFGYGLGFRFFPFYGYGYGRYGGYGYGGYGGYGPYGYGGYGYTNYGGYASSPITIINPAAGAALNEPAAGDFAALGDQAFRTGQYDEAIRNWQHALVDDPSNAGLVMLLGQAYFAKGSFDEAAGAVQQGIQMLPQEKWGTVVENYRELYGDSQAYSNQLRALEAAVRRQPDSPALRFLLGYHYLFLDYPQPALGQLDQVLKLNAQDEMAGQLRDLARGKLGAAPRP